MEIKNIVFVGAGGIAHCLLHPLVDINLTLLGGAPMTIVDHDKFEPNNRRRQYTCEVDRNKAEVVVENFSRHYPEIKWQAVPEKFTVSNGPDLLSEFCAVMVCVDDVKPRKDVIDVARQFDNIVLLCGGNGPGGAYGAIYVRENACELNVPYDNILTHPKIANANSVSEPEEEESSSLQMTNENDVAAALMHSLFGSYVTTGKIFHDEIKADLKTGSFRSIDWKKHLPAWAVSQPHNNGGRHDDNESSAAQLSDRQP